MLVYQVNDGKFHRTLGGAHAAAKRLLSGEREIREIDVPTDKNGVIDILNGGPYQWKTLRRWVLTARGGLLERRPERDPWPVLMTRVQPKVDHPQEQGAKARRDGFGEHMNPWPQGTPEHDSWSEGWAKSPKAESAWPHDDGPPADPKGPRPQGRRWLGRRVALASPVQGSRLPIERREGVMDLDGVKCPWQLKGHALERSWSGKQGSSYARGRCECGWYSRAWTNQMSIVVMGHREHLRQVKHGK